MINFKKYKSLKLEERFSLTQAFMLGVTTGFTLGFYVLGRLSL